MGRARHHHKHKKPFFKSIGRGFKKLGQDIRHEAKVIGHEIHEHPVQAAIIGATAIVGAGAVVLSGGLLAPEVAAGLGEEAAVLGGTEAAIEMASLDAVASSEAAAVGSDFIAVDGANVMGDELAVNVGSEAVNPVAEFEAVPEVVEEPEISSFKQAQMLEEEPELVEQAVDLEPEIVEEPVEAPKQVNPEADAVKNQGAVENVLADEDELVEQTINLNDVKNIDQASVQDLQIIGKSLNIEVSSAEELAAAVEENPSLLTKLKTMGTKGIKAIALIGSVAGGVAVLGNGGKKIVDITKGIKNEPTMSGKMKKIGEILNVINETSKELSGQELQAINTLSSGVNKATKEIEDVENLVADVKQEISNVDEVLKGIKDLELKEYLTDLSNNQQLKQLIKQNRAETNAIKHNENVLDNELKALEKEEEKEIDALVSIKNIIDRPTSANDFLEALSNFQTEDAKLDFLTENYDVLINFQETDIQEVLSAFA